MKKIVLLGYSIALIIAGCQSNNKTGTADSTATDTTIRDTSFSNSDTSHQVSNSKDELYTGNAVSMSRTYLQTSLKDDLSKGIIDSVSRRYMVHEFDLDDDGNKEIFVSLTGTYFCGSGGCNIVLLSSEGKLITNFTVSEIPFIIVPEVTKGWRDLLIQSRGQYHRMKFNGVKYPSNPSMEPVDKTSPVKEVVTVFDTSIDKYEWFNF